MEIVYKLPSGEETSISVDAVIREGTNVSAEVTLDPVEGGVAITDHVIPNPDKLTIEGVISNHPIATPRSHTFGVTGEVRPLELEGTETAASVFQLSGELDRVRPIYEEIRRLIREGVIVRIVTGAREFSSYLLTDFARNRDASTGNSLAFTMGAIEVRIVETKVVKIPTRERRGQKKGSRGVQAAKEVEENSSLFFKLKEKAAAFFGGGE